MKKKTQEPGLIYQPSRGPGIPLHVGLCLLFLGLEIFLLLTFSKSQVGLQFFLLLIALLIFAVPLVLFAYRLYALINSSYRLERDGLHIRWGLRREVIPLRMVEWVRSPVEMTVTVPWSVLPMSGAYLGTIASEGAPTFEFLASDKNKMLFVGTPRCIYAVSPENPGAFMLGFERVLQMGTLNNVEWASSRPGQWILDAWQNKVGRITAILSANLLSLLYIRVGSRFQVAQTISLSFSPLGKPREQLSSVNMLVVPLAATIIWVLGSVLGIILFRQENCRRSAELVWVAVALSILQCLLAAFFIF